MPAKVVDASVIAALAFDEPRADEANGLISEGDLYAPRLLGYELTSTALKKARQHPSEADLIEGGLEWALHMGVHLVNVPHLAVLRLALQTSLSAYDASYLYLARQLNAELVTFDKRLEAASKLT